MFDQVSARYKGLIPGLRGILAGLAGHTQEYLTSVCLFHGYRTSTQQNCLIDLTVSVMRTVSHLTCYCISSVVTYQLNQSLAQQTMTP